MPTRFEQTGVEICERCEMPRAIGESKGYDICRLDSDYASDGYPEPGQEHTWVRVTPPAAPTILPMGMTLAEDRAREMAVIAEYDAHAEQVLSEAGALCVSCKQPVDATTCVVYVPRVGAASQIRHTDCVPLPMEYAS